MPVRPEVSILDSLEHKIELFARLFRPTNPPRRQTPELCIATVVEVEEEEESLFKADAVGGGVGGGGGGKFIQS